MRKPISGVTLEEVLEAKNLPSGVNNGEEATYLAMMKRMEKLELMLQLAMKNQRITQEDEDNVAEFDELSRQYSTLWVNIENKDPERDYRWADEKNIPKYKAMGYQITEDKKLEGHYTFDCFDRIRDRDLILMDICKDRNRRRLRFFQRASINAIEHQKDKYLEETERNKSVGFFESAEVI